MGLKEINIINNNYILDRPLLKDETKVYLFIYINVYLKSATKKCLNIVFYYQYYHIKKNVANAYS